MQYFYLLMLVLFIALVLLIIKPFITAILSAMILSYIFYPLYKWLCKYIKRESIAALLISIIMIIALLIPFAILIEKVSGETQAAYRLTREKITGVQEMSDICNESSTAVCFFVNLLDKLNANENLKLLIENSYNKVSGTLVKAGSDVLFAIPSVVLNIFIVIFITYYLLLEGPQLLRRLEKLIPLSKKKIKKMVMSFDDLVKGIIFGQLTVTLIQGALATIGYLIIGVKSPLFWGLVTMVFSLIPMVGTGIIWVPMSVIILVQGIMIHDNLMIGKAIGLFIYGAFIVGTVDNLLRPKLVGDRARVHPVIILLGILGGIEFFGFMGLIIGPVILATCLQLINIIKSEIE